MGASSIGDMGGGQSGNEGEGLLAPDLTDAVEEGETERSFLHLGRLGPVSLVRPLGFVYMEQQDGAPPSVVMNFQALLEQLILTVLLPYAPDEDDLSNPLEWGMYLSERIGGATMDTTSVAVSGRVLVTPTDEGARLDLEDIVMRAADGTGEEIFGDGVISGEIERSCAYLAILPNSPTQNGGPYPQHVRDEDWSSPFCAQYR